jgi:hypothetical protein
METTGSASACNSFWEEEGTGTGATGADGASGLTQHSGIWQCVQSPQHELAADAFAVAANGDTVMAELAARTNPSSKATTILVSFNVMPALFSRFQNETTSEI